MIQILSIMTFLGAFTFLGMGLSIANSIEAKESKRAADIMLVIMLVGILSFLIGFFGLIIYKIYNNL